MPTAAPVDTQDAAVVLLILGLTLAAAVLFDLWSQRASKYGICQYGNCMTRGVRGRPLARCDSCGDHVCGRHRHWGTWYDGEPHTLCSACVAADREVPE